MARAVPAGHRPRAAIVRQTDLYEYPVKREAEALARAGFDVDLLLMRNADRPRRQRLAGVELTSLPARLHRAGKLSYAVDYSWFSLLAGVTLTVRHLRRRYDVIQVNTMPDTLVFATLVPKLLGAPVVLYMKEPVPELVGSLFGSERLARVAGRLEQLAIRFADRVITVTEEMRDLYASRGADPDRIAVVLNGADAPTMGASPAPVGVARDDGEFRIICHGTIEERYGQDTIIDAAVLLRDEMPDLRVVMVGRGGWADAMVERIAERGAADIVRFEGWVTLERLRELLGSADLGVVAQKASPYSHVVQTNKMVDYWIFGLPVVASRLRSVSRMYGDDVLEYYEPGDPRSLADAIRRLRADPARSRTLAVNGRQTLRQNGWEGQQHVYLDVMRSMLRNGAAANV
jgi:glycosyltransferase involved in cell wall biosynthesis